MVDSDPELVEDFFKNDRTGKQQGGWYLVLFVPGAHKRSKDLKEGEYQAFKVRWCR